ncbi:MAG: response regulator [Nibricoccus sp.]
MKILVTEDNPNSLYLLEQYFAARGHEVWSATNGRDGLALCHDRGLPDIIVSDALMPVMDGFELCTEIRRDPRLKTLPFILYTATYTAESDERFALSIGADRFVIKPIEPDRLLGIVDEVLAEVGKKPNRTATQSQLVAGQLQEYTRMVLVKLEDKLHELSRANTALSASEESVRTLNEKLVNTVHRLEAEIDQHRRADELLRMAQNAGGIGCWESNSAGVHWTDEARTLLGYPGAGGPAKFSDFVQNVAPDDRARASGVLDSLSKSKEKTFELEIRYNCPGQTKAKQLLLRGGLLPGASSQADRWIGIVQDITARKETENRRQLLEQQLFRSQKMEALGNLAGGIAHDFNNILTAILGHADLLRLELGRMPGSSACLTDIAEIENAGQRARDIIAQILTFSRRQPIERQSMVFSKVVEDSLRLVRSAIGKHNKIHPALNCDRLVSVNEGQIQQVLLNLCTNAAHAMAPKGGSITVALDPIDIDVGPTGSRPIALNPGPYVRLRVTDTGSGMDPSVIEHIFEPFFTTKAAGEGTGLGLAVVHGIVQSHEGTIQVESTPGKGTTFSLFFPVSDERAKSGSAAHESAKPNGKGQALLIVDDEPSVARTCAQLVEKLNYRATAITDPNQARDLFERDPQAFAAVIVDYLMPRLTGLDLARALWKTRPDLPVILVAGFGAQMDATRARAEGFHDFLTKPFTTASLAIALARTLGPSQPVAAKTSR